jgi:hypothetical protein
MTATNNQEKRAKAIAKLKQFAKSLGLGILEGGISAALGFGLLKLNIYAMFVILLIWLIFGWISTYFISNNALEILTVMISGTIVAGLIYFLADVDIWLFSLIIGLSLLFWIISFTTKILLFQTKEPTLEDQSKEINEN